MKRIKYRIEVSSEWTEEQMLEELKKNTPNFSDRGEKQNAIIIISIRKVPSKFIKDE
jgi:hypothetical protein